MKKRILALILSIVSICSIFLFSCSDGMTDDEKRISIVVGDENSRKAYTLSIWLPVSEEVKQKYQNNADDSAISNIEKEINIILAERNMATAIEFVLVSEEEYVEALNKQFAISENAAKLENPNNEKFKEIYKLQNSVGPLLPNSIGSKYKNEPLKVDLYDSNGNPTGEYVYQLKYPELLQVVVRDENGNIVKDKDGNDVTTSQQIDIFFIGNYTDYSTWKSKGYMQSLYSYMNSSGDYANLNKLINADILSSVKDGNEIYALPNNHLFAKDKYQVVLIDKNIAGDKISYDEKTGIIKYNDTEINSIVGCKDYICDIASNGTGFIPFVGTKDDASGVELWGNTIISSSIQGGDSAPQNILSNSNYTEYMSFYKELKASGYLKETLGEGEKAAVQVKYATLAEIQKYEADYYVVKSENPIIDDITSMFAISKYSINYDRSMEILNLFMTNEEIITLLNYGIQGVDYKVELDGTIQNLNSVQLTKKYFGNGYYTYYNYGMSDSVWEYVKTVNYDAVVSPYIKSQYALKSYQDIDKLEANYKAIENVSKEVFDLIDAMDDKEFKKLIEVYEEYTADGVKEALEFLAQTDKYNEHASKIDEYKSKLESNKTRLEEIAKEIDKSSEDDDSALTEEQTKLNEENTKLEEDIQFVEKYASLLESKASLELIEKFCNMQEYKDAISQSEAFYSKMQ